MNPVAELALQSHHHRPEYSEVVEGTAMFTVNEEEPIITKNQTAYIPLGSKHRLENPSQVTSTLIEVKTGPYLKEDEVIRYEDRCA